MYGDSTDIGIQDLTFASVKTSANLDAELPKRRAQRHRKPNCPSRSVKRREKSVTGSFDFVPTKARELATHERVVALEYVMPFQVSQLGRNPGRVGNVRKKNGREDSVRFGRLADAG